MRINKDKYKKALDFAYKIHYQQNGGNTDEAIAGLLYDAVED